MTDFIPPVTDMDEGEYTGLECVRDCATYTMALIAFLLFLQTAFAPQGETLGPGGAVSDASGADWEGEQ